MSDTGGETPTIDSWQAVAEKTAAIIRVSGIENFREAVRAVARERSRVQDERERPEEERRKVLKENFTIQRKPSLGTKPSVFYII